jgi:hypothetical protein
MTGYPPRASGAPPRSALTRALTGCRGCATRDAVVESLCRAEAHRETDEQQDGWADATAAFGATHHQEPCPT